jgi:ATP-binding cassette subfamily F protein uup
LDPRATVIDTLCPGGDHVEFRGTRVHINGYLSRFLFRPEHSKLQVGQLSGGEQSRLSLARLMLRPADILVLDEPTNDLDMATLDVLEETVTHFDGAVLLVSHDRYFLDRVTTSLLAFSELPEKQGQIVHLVGLTQWEEWYRDERECLNSTESSEPAKTMRTESEPARRKLSYKDKRDLDTIETRIAEALARVEALETEQAQPEVASHATRLLELSLQISAAKEEVDSLFARWSELETLRGG